jgi:hypothetical protein
MMRLMSAPRIGGAGHEAGAQRMAGEVEQLESARLA